MPLLFATRERPIRLLGLVLLAIAAGCAWLLFHGPAARGLPDLASFAQAATGFLAGSLGTGLVILGRHVPDRVAVSPRWTIVGNAAVADRSRPDPQTRRDPE